MKKEKQEIYGLRKKEKRMMDKEINFNLNLYCDNCRTDTWHGLKYNVPVLAITCDNCKKTINDYVYNIKNSVNRTIWDNYVREKRKRDNKTKD